MLRLTTNRPLAACYVSATLMLLLAFRAVSAADVAVVVEGVTGEVRENVLALLSIYQERERADLSPGRLSRLHEQAPEEIRTALQPFGYYRPRIDASLRQDDGSWMARYEIDPGPRIPVASADVRVSGDGRDDPAFQRLVHEFPLKPGEPLNHALYEQAKRAFQRTAAERGYFDLRFVRNEIRVDLEEYRADISLHIDSGRRYRFGEIEIEQDILDPALVARYVRVVPGQPYSTAALLETQAALADTDYFAGVEVVADPEAARDHVVPVRIRLVARKPDRYTFGIGYGTDTGARLRVGWERRYLNPQGHHVRTELRASRIESSLNAGYFIPIRNPRTDQIAITAGYLQSDFQSTDTEVRHVAVSRTTQRGHLLETLSLRRQNESFVIGTQTGSSALLLPGVTWSYLWGDERIYVRKGARAQLDLRGASDRVGSDTTLFQSHFQAKLIYPVLDFGRFITRVEIGSTRVDNFAELPPSLRFFTGGDVSVRGYAYNSLGPRDATGTVTGAKRLLVGSVEYEQHIVGNWAAAVFYDAGNTLNDFNDALARGAGIGLRWRSPVGQIRLDVASALSLADDPLRLHISIGPDL